VPIWRHNEIKKSRVWKKRLIPILFPENIKIGTPLTADFVERRSWHFVEELAKERKTYLAFRV